ncbi:MAG: GntR family transcriptional regulator [Desulfobacterales bacterium]|nr:GntR family transcriptional regulator [Desulfobacterales bacterium]
MPLPEKNKKIGRPSIRDEVYDNLLNWIMEGVLRPGEKIVDKELAVHLGVSRTPVREALRRLEDKDLVESSANRWTRVAPIPVREPEMIYPVIWTLEKLAASEALANMRPADFTRMAQANEVLASAIDANDPIAASRADADFHDVFIERSLNTHLMKILKDLKIRYRRLEVNFFEGTSYAASSLEEHRDLIAALKDSDIGGAEQIIHCNWEKSLERLRRIDAKQNGAGNES